MTLAETIVSSVLLLLILVPVLRVLAVGQLEAGIIRQKSLSLVLARARLDEIRSRALYDFSVDFTSNSEAAGIGYLCTVGDLPHGDNLRKISVQVGFDVDGDGNLDDGEKQVTLESLLARRWP
jgi:hypothetical protein